ncbi:MAG TPA: histidinol dehydrogenase [Verrucomicrobiae bacterium]|nr:histidinol dehydrogenase [Verrucomicrobiae bacterium]
MKVLRHNQPDFARQLAKALAASSLFDPVIEERVQKIIADVQARGDAGLVELTERFDNVKLNQLAVVGPTSKAPAALKKAIAVAHYNIAAFARRSLRETWRMRNAQGAVVGEMFQPFQRVGIYIPGGTAPLVSTALMTITLAKVAGCPEIVVCTPPPINSSLLYAIKAAGATEIYQVGGAQAIAAMALGTRAIKRVQKIFGPGNAYVVAAKRLLFGRVALDLLPGPSEVLVIADDSANAAFIAADMLAQAEHGSGHERVWLVTTSMRVLEAALAAMPEHMKTLQRREFIAKALANACVCVLAKDLGQAVSIANDFAPEHCELMTKNNSALLKKIKTAGAIFLGPWAPTVAGDYLAGPSHELPTGGAGRSFGGLTVDQFQRRTSVVELTRQSLRKSLPTMEKFAEVEGLDAHAASARKRFE